MFDKKIKAIIILEILGKPKEHIVGVMKNLIETIGKEPGIKIINKKVHDVRKFENKDENGRPIIIQGQEDLFTTFAEIEFEADSVMDLLRICFNYMPASVEIIEPERFTMTNIDFNSLVNEIMRRLHHYDAVAKSALMNNQILANHLQALEKNQQSKDISNRLNLNLTTNPQEKKETKTSKKPVKESKKNKK
jgi:hypothetical protein